MHYTWKYIHSSSKCYIWFIALNFQLLVSNGMCEIMHLFLVCTGYPVLHTTEDSDPDVEVGRCYIVWFSDCHASHEIDSRQQTSPLDYWSNNSLLYIFTVFCCAKNLKCLFYEISIHSSHNTHNHVSQLLCGHSILLIFEWRIVHVLLRKHWLLFLHMLNDIHIHIYSVFM